MNFEDYFRLTSYATVAAASLALFVAGGVGLWLAAAFALLMVVAWKLEGTRWQLSERLALFVILIAIPVFYLDWRILTPFLVTEFSQVGDVSENLRLGGPQGNVEATVLAHLILFLSAIKLFQHKADRDWFFLYLISFFEVLLAAGLTASPAFLVNLVIYLLCALSTVVAFEIHKARRKVTAAQTRLLVPPDRNLFQKLPMRLWRRRYLETRRLPVVSMALLGLIVILALPFFLIAPRTASGALKRGGNGVSGFIGFSDNVTLGQIGRLKSSDEVFMRVKVENQTSVPTKGLRWRGVALDEFTGKGWRKSSIAERSERKQSESGFFKLGTTEDVTRLTAQTFLMEPVDTPLLFGAPRIVAVQGRLPFIRVDGEGAIQTRLHDQDRLIYKAFSDTSEPAPDVLRNDPLHYPRDFDRYRELITDVDPRVGELAQSVIRQAGARNGYDASRAIESYLRDKYGYSLEMKAGGPDPLSDFLFNVRIGHCEYFASAMVVMLRKLGVATRVVNGFLPGEYNDAAGAYTVRQGDAHSWVEVYFPQTNAWVTFDPTPAAGRMPYERTGLAGALSKYSEALELMWFQYVVGYDKEEQRSLVSSLRRELIDLRRESFNKLDKARAALPFMIKPIVVGMIVVALPALILLLTRRIRRAGWRRGLTIWRPLSGVELPRVDFYARFIRLLERNGVKRQDYQTPLEFAATLDSPDAAMITTAYNRVRFGGQELSSFESRVLDEALRNLEKGLA